MRYSLAEKLVMFAMAVVSGLMGDIRSTHATLVINTVIVGNAGNANDTSGFGGVSNEYSIATSEVTNLQYVEFLNNVDPTGANALGLYNSSMTSSTRGGIDFTSGNADGSKYSTKSGRDNNPVVFVNWYDAVRFANWLNNGQGAGSTETGAYTLLGGTPIPSNGTTVSRNGGANWFLPNANEWYKAAYHKNDGVTGNYWDYPTSTDTIPYSDQPPGSAAPDPGNTGNFFKLDGSPGNGYDDGYAVTGMSSLPTGNPLTDVGAYTLSDSPYGTSDQGGNVSEWTEFSAALGMSRGNRGGAWNSTFGSLLSSAGTIATATSETDAIGFRVATSAVPEPNQVLLCCLVTCLGSIAHYCWKMRSS
jgi:formylglycine-generating enzyme required for sulfatase activity